MAGIGFQLKKLFYKEGISNTLKAYMYSTFVSIGPVIVSVVAINFMQYFLRIARVDRLQLELLQATIMYSFMFAVILSSGYCMFISRYLSDVLYENREADVLPALLASLATVVIVCGLAGIIFYARSPLELVYKIMAYALYIGLVIEMLLAVFVSAINDYKVVSFGFLLGFSVAAVLAFIILYFDLMNIIYTMLFCFNLSIFIVSAVLARAIKKRFNMKSHAYLTFLKYLKHVYPLWLINFFYTSGLYTHFFAFWFFTNIAQVVEGTYLYAPYYDIPASFAFLTIMPTLVLFVVKLETGFYIKYRNYFHLINNGAALEDIEVAKFEMKRVLNKELVYIMEIQLFFSIIAMVLGIRFLPGVGFTTAMIDIYSILIIGYYCAVISFVVMTILLYFNDIKSAMMISVSLSVMGFIGSYITVLLGEKFYGVGYFAGGLFTLVLALIRLKYYIKNIEFHIFCQQVAWTEDKPTKFDALIDKLNKIG
jgi:uncharacterized membrane protein